MVHADVIFIYAGLLDVIPCLQDSQQWLGRLIPDKQSLNDQLKQVQQNSLHREYQNAYITCSVQNSETLVTCHKRSTA